MGCPLGGGTYLVRRFCEELMSKAKTSWTYPNQVATGR